MDWYKQEISMVFDALASGEKGLTSGIAEEKLKEVGLNQLQEGKKKSIAGILFAQFKDVMILILLVAAIISGFIGDITDTIVILVIVLLNAAIGFFQELQAEKAILALKQMAVRKANVLRDGNVISISATELVPGDVILLEAGNAVPADIRIVESINLKIEEAALTGESYPADKIANALEAENLPIGDMKNMAFKGTSVSYGRGRGVVVATGMATELGRIAKMLQEADVLTPLQRRLSVFAKKLSVLVLFLCAFFFAAGWWRGEEIMKLLLTSISLAISAIPESLPAVITISLALAAKRMTSINSLIRKLPAVETLGSVTYICTDKTGTLTKNKMHVEEVFVNDKLYDKDKLSEIIDEPDGALLLHAFVLNNDTTTDNNNAIKGDSTEIALVEAVNTQNLKRGTWPRVSEIPFDAERKLMTTFHTHEGKIISFTKGAPDVLVKRCVETDIAKLLQQVDVMAEKGQRTLGFAYRYWNEVPQNPDSENYESGLTFLGLTGLIDPPRDEVFEAVAHCKTAGIIPVMITGDHPLTAKTIARRIGIISSEEDLTR